MSCCVPLCNVSLPRGELVFFSLEENRHSFRLLKLMFVAKKDILAEGRRAYAPIGTQPGRETPAWGEGSHIPDRLHVVHLPRLSRDGTAAVDVHKDRHTHGRNLRLREHAPQAPRRFFPGISSCCF